MPKITWKEWVAVAVFGLFAVAIICASADGVGGHNPHRWIMFAACAAIGVFLGYREVRKRGGSKG